MDSKVWWQSKLIWTNVLAAIGLAIQARTGFVISPVEQGAILIVVNIILRAFFTKNRLTLTDQTP